MTLGVKLVVLILFLILALLPLTTLSGCVGATYLADNNIHIYSNTGKGCITERGQTTVAQGEAGADANVVAQAGQGQAQGSLDSVFISRHDCTGQEDQEQE